MKVVLAMDPGNVQAVLIGTVKTVLSGSRPVQQSDPLLLGSPNRDMY
jgi:hypothetical protein